MRRAVAEGSRLQRPPETDNQEEGNLIMNGHHPYEEEGFEVLCNANDQMHADALLDELDGAGINALQYPGSEESALNFPPPETSGGILILVKKENLEDARALYEKLESGQSEEESE